VKDLDDELTLNEGLNEYTITVTSQDKKTTQTYNIKIIKLPDLSLKTFKITKELVDENNFELDLEPRATQDVYLSYSEGITVVAEANSGSGASVDISPASFTLGASGPTTVTVNVSKTLDGVTDEYKRKNYILYLYYGTGVPSNSLAEGGFLSFTPGTDPNSYDEVHKFLASGSLSFLVSPSEENPVTAWILVVGGGGSGGGAHSPGNHGGAGGVAEHTSYPLTAGSYAVVVGAGGAGVTIPAGQYTPPSGTNGQASSFGGVFTGYGGGGGGGNYRGQNQGNSGGSSGGSGNGDERRSS
jgi:hypothetical protein